nr:MAG TPA: hypothetical protein [Caudoviricetes sp.]
MIKKEKFFVLFIDSEYLIIYLYVDIVLIHINTPLFILIIPHLL